MGNKQSTRTAVVHCGVVLSCCFIISTTLLVSVQCKVVVKLKILKYLSEFMGAPIIMSISKHYWAIYVLGNDKLCYSYYWGSVNKTWRTKTCTKHFFDIK